MDNYPVSCPTVQLRFCSSAPLSCHPRRQLRSNFQKNHPIKLIALIEITWTPLAYLPEKGVIKLFLSQISVEGGGRYLLLQEKEIVHNIYGCSWLWKDTCVYGLSST